MAEILTSKYKQDLLRKFYLDTQPNANTALSNDYYMMIGRHLDADGRKITSVNSQHSKNQFLNTILFAKKIDPTDIKVMIKYNPWQEGAIFDQYDDREDMSDKKFVCVVGPNLNKTGDYRVFKCLSNNNGGKVVTHPEYDITNEDQIYPVLTDGYIWKYMYRITAAEFEAYNAVGYIPIEGDYQLDPFDTANSSALATTTGGPINKIIIENRDGNNGYEQIKGSIGDIANTDNQVTIETNEDNRLSEIEGFYVGMTMAVTTTGPTTRLFEITRYTYDSSDGSGDFVLKSDNRVTGPNVVNVALTNAVQIAPTVKIEGDGSGCEARSEVKEGAIDEIIIVNSGSGYHDATAKIVDPPYDFDPDNELTVDVRADLRPVISPPGGHDTDRIAELEADRVLLYAYINETNNNVIGANNTFSTIGVIKNPDWANTSPDYSPPEIFDNRIAIVTDDYSVLEINTTIQQVDANNDIIFSGNIHDIDTTSNTIYISEYTGPYTNTTDNDTALDLNYNLVSADGTTIEINTPVADNVTESPYIQRSGILYFMEDFTPLERTNQSREEYKLVLEF